MRHEDFGGLAATYSTPTYHQGLRLWLYGNAALLKADRAYVGFTCSKGSWTEDELRAVDAMADNLVLEGKILVCGAHSDGHRRAAVAPLRWGCPRIVAFSGGFRCHLGEDLRDEPFRAAKLWRHEWDARTDLAVSLRAPERPPTFRRVDPTVDRLITRLAGPDGKRFADGCPPLRDPDPVRQYSRVTATR